MPRLNCTALYVSYVFLSPSLRSSSLIQIAPQPGRSKMTTRVGLSDVADGGWCLSHLPGWGCFISHYCSSSHSKQVLKRLYTTSASHSLGSNFTVQYLTVSFKY